MLMVLAAVMAIGRFPPDPRTAAAAALHHHDYRLAGVSTFWDDLAARKASRVPYGLRCRSLPDSAWAYAYFVSDAIAPEALDGYRRQAAFMLVYNRAMLASGKLPAAWGCTKDTHPGRFR